MNEEVSEDVRAVLDPSGDARRLAMDLLMLVAQRVLGPETGLVVILSYEGRCAVSGTIEAADAAELMKEWLQNREETSDGTDA